MKPTTLDAYRLLHQGTLALSLVEANGIRIDVKYLTKARRRTQRTVKEMEERIKSSDVWKTWRKTFGGKSNLGSRDQLGKVLFDVMEIPCNDRTATGRAKVDEDVLSRIDVPFVKDYLRMEKLKKADATFLNGIERETVDGFLHPVFSLNMARTYRSCISKGTLIETVRDVSKYPKGVPIEDVREGDYVYCYDDNLNLTIRKVLWAGKTGHKKVIRLHWGARGKKGHLDLTPEHKVRLVDGRYVKAKDLIGDFRRKSDSRHAPKIRALALGRRGGTIWQTGVVEPLLDHRFVYQQLVGHLEDDEVVHHRDENHLNNAPINLEKMTLSEHSRWHAPKSLSDRGRRKGLTRRMELHRQFGDRWKSGEENVNWLKMSKFQLLRILAEKGGRSARTPHDFNTFKGKARLLSVNLKSVKDRYDKNGNYISLGRLRSVFTGRVKQVVNAFGINYAKAKRMLRDRGLSYEPIGPSRNPYGRKGLPNNHKILKVEWIDKKCDVYDLEVEEYHNFIANEICVHNSSDSPNFQNFPVRDADVGKLIRSCFVPRPGNVLVEMDYAGIEVRISAAYHRDPVMLEYINDPTKDMHRDMAAQIYCIKPEHVSKKARYCAKNQFVFPEFYGSYWGQCAPHLWDSIAKHGLEVDGVSIKKMLRRKGIKSLGETISHYKDGRSDLDGRSRGAGSGRIETKPGTFMEHIRQVEQDFWGVRFRVYDRWKKRWWDDYMKRGGFKTLTGFWIEGVMKRNDVINYPVQGSAFHCLLWSLIRLQRELRRRKMRALIVGQIHDSIVADVPAEELDDFLILAKRIMTKEIRKHWKWIIVPLDIEAEVAESNWFEKKPVET